MRHLIDIAKQYDGTIVNRHSIKVNVSNVEWEFTRFASSSQVILNKQSASLSYSHHQKYQ